MDGIARRCSFIGLALSCTSSALGRQASQAPATRQAAKIQVGVNSVLVPVVVTDEQGRAVANLVQQDFQLMDDGRPRAITGFSVQQPTGPLAAGNAGRATPSVPAGSADSAPLEARSPAAP